MKIIESIFILFIACGGIVVLAYLVSFMIERINPCGDDDFEDYEIKDKPKRRKHKEGAIYE